MSSKPVNAFKRECYAFCIAAVLLNWCECMAADGHGHLESDRFVG
jgi:hypothetical protein